MDTTEFFNDFVKKYPIYQNNRTFQILIDKYRDVFVKDIYDDIPQIFKRLYEQGEIPEDVYDYFLTDIGVSQQLISELSINEKLIFIKSLSDFQKYKSTVGLVKSVVQAYGDSVEVYELYVDYNSKQSRWECKPYLLYKPEYSDGYDKTIPYKLVYEKIPSLLIHENQLDKMRADCLALFPIKTNVIFVTSNYNQSVTSYIQSLVISIFYNHFYDENIELLFSDTLIQCNLHQFVLIWMYLILINNNSFVDRNASGLSVIFNKSLINELYTIEDLDTIINEYESINGTILAESCRSNEIKTTQLDEFYYKYIYSLKVETEQSDSVLNSNKIKSWLKIENPNLINYIDKRIDQENNITYIFNDLIQSIEVFKRTTTSVQFVKYFKYFKTFLPTVDLLPIQNTVYKILYYTKPFHTELLDLTDLSLITSNDKFNNIYVSHFYHNKLLYELSDVLEVEDFNKSIVRRRTLDTASVISFISRYLGEVIRTDEIELKDQDITKFISLIKFLNPDLLDIQSLIKKFFGTKNYITDNVSVISYISKNIGKILASDELSLELKYLCLSLQQIKEDVDLFDIPIHLYQPDLLEKVDGYGIGYGMTYGGLSSINFPSGSIW